MITSVNAKVKWVASTKIRDAWMVASAGSYASFFIRMFAPAVALFIWGPIAIITLVLLLRARRRFGRVALQIGPAAIEFDRPERVTIRPANVQTWSFDGSVARLYEGMLTWSLTPASEERARLRDSLIAVFGAPAPLVPLGSRTARNICLAFCAASVAMLVLGLRLRAPWLAPLGFGYTIVGLAMLWGLWQRVPAGHSPFSRAKQ